MNKWTKVHSHGWLAVQGLDMKGNAEELHSCVKEYIECPKGLKGPQGGEVANVHAVLITALKAMVSQLMCQSITNAHVDKVD